MTFLELAINLLPKTKTEAATDAIALAAVLSPAWILELEAWHAVLAIVLQLLGIGWLAVQVFIKIHTTYWKKK